MSCFYKYLPTLTISVLCTVLILTSRIEAISPTPSISPSASHTPRPGTIDFSWARSPTWELTNGSPVWVLWRTCKMQSTGRTSSRRGFRIDRSLHDCLWQCLSSIKGTYCSMWNPFLWLDRPPTTPSCALQCGATLRSFDVRRIRDGAQSTISIYSATNYISEANISPLPSPNASGTPGSGSPIVLPTVTPSASAAPSVGLPRITNESELPTLDEDESPEENSQSTSDNLEFYVYTGITRTNPSAGIRSIFEITEYSDLSLVQLDNTTRLINVATRTVAVAQCALSRCSTRVRIWSDNEIGRGVVFDAVVKLRRQPSFRRVYTIFWTKIIRRQLTPRQWSIEIPFSRAYQRSFANNKD